MIRRTYYSSGAPWEPVFGYSRAVRVGDTVFVSGTTALDEQGRLVGEGDLEAQTAQALSNVERALRASGAELRHVVRTRVFVTDISRWEEAARAHGAVFGQIRPASSLLEVRRLIDERMLVEIEAEAVVA